MGAVEKADLGTITHPSGGIPMGTPVDPDGGCGTVVVLLAGGKHVLIFPRVSLKSQRLQGPRSFRRECWVESQH